MSDALEEHDGKVSIGGRNITNLRFADDIDALAEEEQELEALVESLDKTCTRYKSEISAEKTKLMKLFRKGKTCILVTFHGTDLVICSHFRKGKKSFL